MTIFAENVSDMDYSTLLVFFSPRHVYVANYLCIKYEIRVYPIPITEHDYKPLFYFNSRMQKCTSKCFGSLDWMHIYSMLCQFHLVCDQSWKKPLAISLQFYGTMIGSALAGYIADR